MSMYDARRPQSILVGTLAAKDLSAASAFAYNEVLLESCAVSRLFCKVTVDLVTSAACVVTFYGRPTYGSDTSALNLGTVKLPDAAVANDVYYKDIDPVSVPAGYQVTAEVTTAAGTSGSALAGFLAQYTPEEPANLSQFIASA